MPDYVKGLSEADKQRYNEKLCIDGVVHPDPFDLPETSWEVLRTDAGALPPLGMANIVVYLIFSPSRFTAETVQAYKSLEAYNYFESGLVRDCKMWKSASSNVHIICAKILPSQQPTGIPHRAWVALCSVTGQVRTGHCTCKAGLTEVCSHVAALLYAMEYTVRMAAEKGACTSNPCAWSSKVSKQVQMVPVDSISFSKPGKEKRLLPTEPDSISETFHETDRVIFERLKEVKPEAVIFTSIPKLDPEETDSASEDEECYTFLRHCKRTGSTQYSLLEDLFVPLCQIQKVERATRQQSNTPMWFEARFGRITASLIHRIKTHQSSTDPKNIINAVLQENYSLNTEAIQWGKQHEIAAKKDYSDYMMSNHKDFKLHDIGFVIDTKSPFLGASPDGLWECSCHGVGILEVKCPWSLREPDASLEDVDWLDSGYKLKATHSYYTQVQAQLHVCQKNIAHFVVWSPHAFLVQDIVYDKEFFDPVRRKAQNFWSTFIAPELLK